MPEPLLAHANEHDHVACHDLFLFARTQPDLRLGTLSTDAVSPPGHVASLCHPDSPQRPAVLPDKSGWHAHWDHQEQAWSPRQRQLQAPEHQKPTQDLVLTHVDTN